MGITGLLPLLKSIHKPCHIKKFAGLTIGVDTYGWLHRGTVSCAIDLALEKPTTKFVDFAMGRVRMLIHFGVIPYLVFDGDYLPSKAETESERAQKRAESKRIGLDLYRLGKTSEAHSELQKAVDVTPEMARQLIDELKLHNINYVVAPYEADAQLAYLERRGLIQGILSEDSDLLVFGSKLLLTKLDQYGECVAISRDDFTACRDVNLAGWTDEEFRRMAILSGCDYLPNISKMGLKKAHRMVRKYKTIDKIVRMIQFDGQYRVPPGYLDDFRKAELTFLHQRVFCPDARRLVMFTEMGNASPPEDFAFIGKDVSADIAVGVARGDLNPVTKDLMPSSPSLMSGRSPLPSGTRIPRRHSHISTPQNGKTIEKFFTARRTPLAELDPNVFTPSPSQQRLLGQQNAWSGVPVVRTATPYSTASAPQHRSTSISSTHALSNQAKGSKSASSSSKRQRLCDDPTEDPHGLPGTSLEGRSRFFSSVRGSPSCTKRARKKVEVNIWSDASLDEALSNLPDVCAIEADSAGKMSIYHDQASGVLSEDPSMVAGTEKVELEEFQDQGPRASTLSQQPWQPRVAGSTSDTLPRQKSSIKAEPKARGLPPPQLLQLSDRFSYQAEEAAPAAPAKPVDRKGLSQLKGAQLRNPPSARTSAPIASIQLAQEARQSTPQRMRTPLQRLQAASLRQSHCFDQDSSQSGQALVPQSPVNRPKLQLRGSEDCLVPNSDDDRESDADAITGPAPEIDLERLTCPQRFEESE